MITCWSFARLAFLNLGKCPLAAVKTYAVILVRKQNPMLHNFSTMTYQLQRITYQLSFISYHLSAITYQQSPISYHQRSDTCSCFQSKATWNSELPSQRSDTFCCFQSRGQIQLRTSSPEVTYILLLLEQRSDTTQNFQPRGQIRFFF